MDYGDKLPPRPWYVFTPPRRYIFTPPLTIRDARRWIRSGKALLADRLADASKMADPTASQAPRISGELLDEEAALADRFEAVLGEAEAALRAGGPLPEAVRARLVHGGARTASALLERRARLRFKLGIAD